jgi:hypothetical protein
MQISERFQIKKLASDTAKGTFDTKTKNHEKTSDFWNCYCYDLFQL